MINRLYTNFPVIRRVYIYTHTALLTSTRPCVYRADSSSISLDRRGNIIKGRQLRAELVDRWAAAAVVVVYSLFLLFTHFWHRCSLRISIDCTHSSQSSTTLPRESSLHSAQFIPCLVDLRELLQALLYCRTKLRSSYWKSCKPFFFLLSR